MRTTLALALASLLAAPASAGTISLQLSHRVELKDGELRAAVTLSNGGDEPAHAVTPVLRFRGAEQRGATTAKLEPGAPIEAALAVPAAALGDGHWPYELLVEYADANLYPFEALSVGTLTLGSPPLPRLAVTLPASSVLAGTAELPVKLKNLSDQERRVAVRVAAPTAIEQKHSGAETVLAPWAEQVVDVALTNRAALPGSTYPVFVTAEYEDGGVHQALIGQGTLEIREPSAAAKGPSPLVVAGVVAVLAVLVVAYRLRRR